MHITLPSLALLVYALSTAQCAVSIPIPSSGSASNAASGPKRWQDELREHRKITTDRGSLANALEPPTSRATLPSTSQPQAPLPLAQPPSASSAHQQQAESHPYATQPPPPLAVSQSGASSSAAQPPPPSAHPQPALSHTYATQPPPPSAHHNRAKLDSARAPRTRAVPQRPQWQSKVPLDMPKPGERTIAGTLGVIEEGNYRQLDLESLDEAIYKCDFPGCGVLEKYESTLLRHQQSHATASSSATRTTGKGSAGKGGSVKCDDCANAWFETKELLKAHKRTNKHKAVVEYKQTHPS